MSDDQRLTNLKAFITRLYTHAVENPCYRPSYLEREVDAIEMRNGSQPLAPARVAGFLARENEDGFYFLGDILHLGNNMEEAPKSASLFPERRELSPLVLSWQMKNPVLWLLARNNFSEGDIAHICRDICPRDKSVERGKRLLDSEKLLTFLIAVDQKIIPPQEVFNTPSEKGLDFNYGYDVPEQAWPEMSAKVNAHIKGFSELSGL